MLRSVVSRSSGIWQYGASLICPSVPSGTLTRGLRKRVRPQEGRSHRLLVECRPFIPAPFTQMSAGNDFACGLRPGGSVTCWGDDGYNDEVATPKGRFTAVSAGLNCACALRADGGVQCWGTSLDVKYPGGTPLGAVVASDPELQLGVRVARENTGEVAHALTAQGSIEVPCSHSRLTRPATSLVAERPPTHRVGGWEPQRDGVRDEHERQTNATTGIAHLSTMVASASVRSSGPGPWLELWRKNKNKCKQRQT